MPTYLMLLRYTQTGIQNIKEPPSRLDAARQLASSLGAEIKAVYLTTGRYDLAVMFEAPDDETVARFALAVGSRGAVSTKRSGAIRVLSPRLGSVPAAEACAGPGSGAGRRVVLCRQLLKWHYRTGRGLARAGCGALPCSDPRHRHWPASLA